MSGRIGLEAGNGLIRETEKPKVSGWSIKRRLSIVDLPDPEGPDITIGRCFRVAIKLKAQPQCTLLTRIAFAKRTVPGEAIVE